MGKGKVWGASLRLEGGGQKEEEAKQVGEPWLVASHPSYPRHLKDKRSGGGRLFINKTSPPVQGSREGSRSCLCRYPCRLTWLRADALARSVAGRR
jgi:hypothetical protein